MSRHTHECTDDGILFCFCCCYCCLCNFFISYAGRVVFHYRLHAFLIQHNDLTSHIPKMHQTKRNSFDFTIFFVCIINATFVHFVFFLIFTLNIVWHDRVIVPMINIDLRIGIRMECLIWRFAFFVFCVFFSRTFLLLIYRNWCTCNIRALRLTWMVSGACCWR